MGKFVLFFDTLLNRFNTIILISPGFVLGLVLSSFYGFIFFLLYGHGWSRLFLFWLTGIVGYNLGQMIARGVGLALFNVGTVSVIEGTLACWLSLFAVRAWRR